MGPRGHGPPVMMHAWAAGPSGRAAVSNSVCSPSFSARAANFGQIARDSTTRSGSTRRGRTTTLLNGGLVVPGPPPISPSQTHIRSPSPALRPGWSLSLSCSCAVLLLWVACRRRSLLLCDTFRFPFDSPLTPPLPPGSRQIRADHRAAARQKQDRAVSLALCC